jgi:hypothetical protein
MTLYDIKLQSCDDSLTVTADLDPVQLSAVELIAELTDKASDHCCQPYMTVTEHTEVTE